MPTRTYTELAISEPDGLIFGQAQHPLTCGNELIMGDGVVHPETNFPLPPMEVTGDNMPGKLEQYGQMPPLTENPVWGGADHCRAVQMPRQLSREVRPQERCSDNANGHTHGRASGVAEKGLGSAMERIE